MHYQPKVALPSRQVVGAEALVRWKHPEFGRVDPDEFVPAVEATGLGDMAVVRSIVELGHSLQLTVVAEGVEDDAARDQLIGMGCDVAQGYLISRPLSEDRFEAWLRARTAETGPDGESVVIFLRWD
ncbi:hypothetical protein GCM10009634_35880 [Saccharothrix xinjiangensis]